MRSWSSLAMLTVVGLVVVLVLAACAGSSDANPTTPSQRRVRERRRALQRSASKLNKVSVWVFNVRVERAVSVLTHAGHLCAEGSGLLDCCSVVLCPHNEAKMLHAASRRIHRPINQA